MVTPKDIVTYFDQCEIDYKLVWNLDKSMAMHYGYWDETTRTFHQALQRENVILAERAHISPSDKVLDAGCGVGGSAIWLARNIGCEVFGITLSDKQVQTARKNAEQHSTTEKVWFFRKDYTRTGFPARSFDVVWAIESACHATDKQAFLREAYRLLKKDGRLILADFFQARSYLPPEEKKLLKTGHESWMCPGLNTPCQFQHYLQKTGFRAINIRDETIHIQPIARRLYCAYYVSYPIAKILETIGLRNKIQQTNMLGAKLQYTTLKKGLWKYCIVYAEK